MMKKMTNGDTITTIRKGLVVCTICLQVTKYSFKYEDQPYCYPCYVKILDVVNA